MLNFIAIDLQLYKILNITRVSFFGTQCIIRAESDRQFAPQWTKPWLLSEVSRSHKVNAAELKQCAATVYEYY